MKTSHRGTETISGYPCEKTVYEKEGRKITIWFSKKLDLALKTEMSMPGEKGQTLAMTTELKNVKLQTPPASLFVPPAGFKKEVPQPPKMPPMSGPGPTGRGR